MWGRLAACGRLAIGLNPPTHRSQHPRNRKPVIPLRADRLNHRRAYPLIRRHQFVKPPHSLHIRVARLRIDHRPHPHHGIGDNQAPRARQLYRPRKIFGIAHLIRVNENQIERTFDPRQRLQRFTEPNLHDISQARALDIRPRDLSMLRIGLQRNQPPPPASPLASQMVEYPPSVPISRILRAPRLCTSSISNLP
jgi:hypothetical protein